MDKLSKLKGIIAKMGSVVIAFSGGVDSAFLLKVASLVLPKKKLLAVTANSPTYPYEELDSAKRFASLVRVRHKVINTGEFKDSRFTSNPVDRCYFCKKELFRRVGKIAKESGFKFVLDASTISDRADFRPGNRAKKESGVRSPLEEAGFTKEDVRALSRKLQLSTWDKPSLACLASRIPYGTKISKSLLKQIHTAESFLIKQGFSQVRLRHYNGLCRIEVPRPQIQKLIKRREHIVDRLKKLGYNYITVDLEGYRTGSLNKVRE